MNSQLYKVLDHVKNMSGQWDSIITMIPQIGDALKKQEKSGILKDSMPRVSNFEETIKDYFASQVHEYTVILKASTN